MLIEARGAGREISHLKSLPARPARLTRRARPALKFTGAKHQRGTAVAPARYNSAMSYNLTLDCGCIVYVACDPKTQNAHTRILETRGQIGRAHV